MSKFDGRISVAKGFIFKDGELEAFEIEIPYQQKVTVKAVKAVADALGVNPFEVVLQEIINEAPEKPMYDGAMLNRRAKAIYWAEDEIEAEDAELPHIKAPLYLYEGYVITFNADAIGMEDRAPQVEFMHEWSAEKLTKRAIRDYLCDIAQVPFVTRRSDNGVPYREWQGLIAVHNAARVDEKTIKDAVFVFNNEADMMACKINND